MDWLVWGALIVIMIVQLVCFIYLWSKILRREESTRLYLEEQKRVLLGCVQSIESNQKVMVDAIAAAQQSVNVHTGTTSTKVADIWTAVRAQKASTDNLEQELSNATNNVLQAIDQLGGMVREVQTRPAPRRGRKNNPAPSADDLPAVPEGGFPVHEPITFESGGTTQGTR
jgi:uncharacterized protein YoxC